jgi:hypothetical protein
MRNKNNYPAMNVDSMHELSRRLSGKGVSREKMLEIINHVNAHYYDLWHDNKSASNEAKGKFVRSASRNHLYFLLKRVNNKLLKPNDHLVPGFIFGGLSGRSAPMAAKNLVGKKYRTLLATDISKFFESVTKPDLVKFFLNSGCAMDVAHFLAKICCVPIGKKCIPRHKLKVLARGFSTSSRLAVWCKLSFFVQLRQLVFNKIDKYSPRLSIFVDDIGITASGITNNILESLYEDMRNLAKANNLILHPFSSTKTRIMPWDRSNGAPTIFGNVLAKKTIAVGSKWITKHAATKHQLKKAKETDAKTRKKLVQRRKGLMSHKRYAESFNISKISS